MRSKLFQRFDFILVMIALLSGFLNIYNIWKDQTANAYYTAAVTSMLQSFHNFFFVSFDPGGFVTVDKPPVTFWIQALSAYLFGVKGWSVILPQALAGIGSVLLMYFMVKSTFGKGAARLASLVLACTPIAAAVSRTNNVDSLLVFTLLLGSWMLFRGIRRDQWVWVIAGFAAIGLAFNIKMLQAYMVVPAFYLFYLFASKLNWRTKSKVLAGATAILIIVSISWAVIVDSIPKENRPYIGSSQTNSVMELAFGYNGIARLTGDRNGGANGGGIGAGGPGGGKMPNQAGQSPSLDGSRGQTGAAGDNGARGRGAGGPGGGPGGGGAGSIGKGGRAPGGNGNGGGGMFHTGTAGPLRLFQSDLSGQISWLLPFVAFASIGLLAGIRRRKPLTSKHKETLFWLAWLLPAMAFFSVAGFFHQYYLIMLAPPIAALTGAGWVELCQLYRNKESWKSWLLPAGILATIVFQIIILAVFTTQISLGWSIGLGIAGTGLLLALVLGFKKEKINRSIALAAILVLLVAPLYWAATPLLYGGDSKLPVAGPQLNSSSQGMSAGLRDGGKQGGSKPGEVTDTALLNYLTTNNTGEKYLFATTSAGAAESYIIDSGKAVMAMGGYIGSDPILTIDKLKALVANKEVKYFMFSSGDLGDGGTSDVTAWIKANSTVIPSSEWQTSAANSTQGSPMGMGGSATLYKINS